MIIHYAEIYSSIANLCNSCATANTNISSLKLQDGSPWNYWEHFSVLLSTELFINPWLYKYSHRGAGYLRVKYFWKRPSYWPTQQERLIRHEHIPAILTPVLIGPVQRYPAKVQHSSSNRWSALSIVTDLRLGSVASFSPYGTTRVSSDLPNCHSSKKYKYS